MFLLGLLIEFQGLLRLIHLIFEHGIAQQHPDVVGELLHRLLVLLFGLRELAALGIQTCHGHVEFDARLGMRFQGNGIIGLTGRGSWSSSDLTEWPPTR